MRRRGFARHGSTPITEIPSHWPAAYRDLVQRRLDLIESDPGIRLLERPEYKRRWATEPWEKQQERALRDWLLTASKDRRCGGTERAARRRSRWPSSPSAVSVDAELLGVLELWSGRPGADVAVQLSRPAGRRARAVPGGAALQAVRPAQAGAVGADLGAAAARGRGARRSAPIPVPPKYTTGRLRQDVVLAAPRQARRAQGALHLLPRRRARRRPDPGARLGRLGPRRAGAGARRSGRRPAPSGEGWDADRLTPLLAGLAELEPWLHQWHAEIDPRMGVSPAQAMTGTLERELARLGLTRTDLAAWRPPAADPRSPSLAPPRRPEHDPAP